MKFTEQRQSCSLRSDILTPGAGLFCSITLIMGTIINQSFSAIGIFFFLAVCLALWTQNIKRIVSILLPINAFMILMWVTLPFTISDDSTSIHFIYLSISLKGVSLAFLLTLKANTTALFFLSFVTNNPHELGKTLQSLRFPTKLITLFILFYQHIGLLHKDFVSAIQSLSLRAPKLKGITALKIYAYLVGTILVHNINRAENIRMVLARRASPLIYISKPCKPWRATDIALCALILSSTISISLYFGRSS